MFQGCGGEGTTTTATTTLVPCTGTCFNAGERGDGWCDDENNNCGCDWDGGDCCGDNVNTYYCTKCDCLDPSFNSNTTTTTTTTTTPAPCTGTCFNPDGKWKGDGWCDDPNNNCGCEWDGGDCCGDNVKTKYCTKCECLDPSFNSYCDFTQSSLKYHNYDELTQEMQDLAAKYSNLLTLSHLDDLSVGNRKLWVMKISTDNNG